MNELVSLFIDDEMNLAEKKVFVETVHRDDHFYGETLDLIEQEMILAGDPVERTPVLVLPAQAPERGKRFPMLFPSLGAGLAAAAMLVFWLLTMNHHLPQARMNRFVVYKPEASRVEITGSFTGWEKIPLHEAGDSGYWEVTLELPPGVHRFTYILDGHTTFADPTVLTCEQDDFGGVDSIINTEI